MKRANFTKRFLLYVFSLFCTINMMGQQLAFPGAMGWGSTAIGGRNGSVYHVTNLNDTGAGSLRDAVSQPNRIVVFDVAGVIKINSRIVFAKNLLSAEKQYPQDSSSFGGLEDIPSGSCQRSPGSICGHCSSMR